MVTERTLRKWRKEALHKIAELGKDAHFAPTVEVNERILRLTQELLDQHLIRKPTR